MEKNRQNDKLILWSRKWEPLQRMTERIWRSFLAGDLDGGGNEKKKNRKEKEKMMHAFSPRGSGTWSCATTWEWHEGEGWAPGQRGMKMKTITKTGGAVGRSSPRTRAFTLPPIDKKVGGNKAVTARDANSSGWI